jgi:hypothetical protein
MKILRMYDEREIDFDVSVPFEKQSFRGELINVDETGVYTRDDVLNLIEKLGLLRDEGFLTEQEFEKKT